MTAVENQIAEIICALIKSRSVVKFFYTDTTKLNNDWRIVEPHLVGVNKNTNLVQLRAWFIPNEGQVLAGEQEGWRLYRLDNISNIENLGSTFTYNRPLYNPNDKSMIRILCRV